MTGYKSPPRRRTPEFHVTENNTIRNRLQADYDLLGTWKAVGAKYKVSSGMAYRVAVYGYEPHKASIRAALDLPVTVSVTVCPHCGQPPLVKHHHCHKAAPAWVGQAANWLAARERR